MDITDKELLDSALADEQPEVIEQPEQAEQDQGQPRDEQGRFATTQAEPEQTEAPATQQPPQAQLEHPQGFVPSGRLREERERAEAAERRFNEAQANWQRQFEQLQTRLPQPEPPKRPDVFENPDAFLDHGVKQAIEPIQGEFGKLKEFYSKREAIRDHGMEKVSAAYNAIAEGLQTRDPEAQGVYQRAMQSMDPFGEIVAWHQQKTVFSQIGHDPNAWFEKELERRMVDPKFAASYMEKVQQSARGAQKPQGTIVQLPPSLNKVPQAQASSEDDNDMSDGALFRQAMR